MLISITGAGVFGVFTLLAENTVAEFQLVGGILTYYLWNLLIFLFASLIVALTSFFPKIRGTFRDPKTQVSNDINLLYFGTLRLLEPLDLLEHYKERLGENSIEQVTDFHRDLARQIIANSSIAFNKFEKFRLGIWLIFFGLLTPIGGLIFLVFRRLRGRN